MNRLDETIGRIETDIKWIKKELTNHLKHHWAVEMILLTFIGGLLIKIFFC